MSEEPECPACLLYSDDDATDSELLVVTATKAMLEDDRQTILDCMTSSTPYDFHVAVTMLTGQLLHLSEIYRVSPLEVLTNARAAINAERPEH